MGILSTIESNVEELINLGEFASWKSEQTWNTGDLCLLNSSFLLRDGVRTNQASRRLALQMDAGGRLRLAGVVDAEKKVVAPFKRFASASSNLPTIMPLNAAVQSELSALGDVLFTLIGDLAPAAAGAVAVSGLPGIEQVQLDTSLATPAAISNEVIFVNNTYDEEGIWMAIRSHFQGKSRKPGEHDLEFRPSLATAIEELEDAASRTVTVPTRGTVSQNPLLKELSSGLLTQALEYQEALHTWTKSAHSDGGALHQILRISYNFASDAVRLIRLIISVCDLKPLVFWCTAKEHHVLNTAIGQLPWQTHSKASLGAYAKIVSTARNHAFHDLFPVISGLHVELPDAALRKVRLKLFARHGSKKNRNEVRFEDQELVELLTEFTRAGRRTTPPTFWEQNLMAMQATVELLEATTRSLLTVRADVL